MTVLCISCDNANKQMLYPLFSKHDGPEFLSKMFNEVTGIELFDSEELPKHICYTCFDELIKAHAFRRNCISLFQQRTTHTALYLEEEKSAECSQNSNKTIETSTVLMEHPSIDEYTKIIIKEECETPPHDDSDDYEAYEVLEDRDFDENNSLSNDYLLDDSIESTSDVEVLEVDPTYSKFPEQISNEEFEKSIYPILKETKKSKERLALSSDDIKIEYPEDNITYGTLGSFTILPSPNNSTTLKLPLNYKQCEFCHEEFESSSKRAIHERIHSSEERPYRCSLKNCDKRFKNKYASNQHLSRIHYASKMYQCNLCSKIIMSRSTALLHEMHHYNFRPYQCSYCEKSFHAKNNMQQHMRQHTGEKPMKCHLCPRSFVSSYSLRIHIRVHKQEKPYLCNQCGKTFTSSSQLRSHMKRIHIKERPVKCKDCKAAFFDTTGLNRHIRKHCPKNRYAKYHRICDTDQ